MENLPIAAADVQPVSIAPVIPPGIPPTDPTKPKWALTQDQIDFLLAEVSGIWPAFKAYWPAIVAIAAAFGIGGGLTGRYTAPATTPTTIVAPHVDPIVPPSPIVPPTVAKRKVIFYITAADYSITTDDRKVLEAAGVSYELAKAYPAGTGYKFGDRVVPMPCAVLFDSAGKALDVAPYPVADLAAFVKGK